MIETKKAFTLLELLLSVALIGVITTIGVPIYQSFQVRNDLDIASNNIYNGLRRAQLLSQASKNDSNWGIKVQPSQIIIFKGTDYSSRDASFDEVFDLTSGMSISGISEVVFSKLDGYPNVTGTITLNSNTNETRNISINSKGRVE